MRVWGVGRLWGPTCGGVGDVGGGLPSGARRGHHHTHCSGHRALGYCRLHHAETGKHCHFQSVVLVTFCCDLRRLNSNNHSGDVGLKTGRWP